MAVGFTIVTHDEGVSAVQWAEHQLAQNGGFCVLKRFKIFRQDINYSALVQLGYQSGIAMLVVGQ